MKQQYEHITQLEVDYFSGKPIWYYWPILIFNMLLAWGVVELTVWALS